MTTELVAKLIEGFKMGFNDSECCAYCDIARDLYYDYLKRDPKFIDRVNKAKEHPYLKAKHTIMKNMDKPEMARWFLEKRRKEEFGDVKKIELETTDKFEKMSVEEKLAALEANESE